MEVIAGAVVLAIIVVSYLTSVTSAVEHRDKPGALDVLGTRRRCGRGTGAVSTGLAAKPGPAAGVTIAGSALLLTIAALLAVWILTVVERHAPW